MRKHVIAITDHEDAHLPFVQAHLDDPLHIFDPQELLADTALSFELRNHEMVVTYGATQFDANNVSGVWYRKPRRLGTHQIKVADGYKEYAATSINALVSQWQSALDKVLWISDYNAIMRAESKVLQLELAAKLGFRVPATIMTSDSSAALRFIDAQDHIIVKRLASSFPKFNGVQKVFYTTKINKKALPDMRNLALAPAIFQEAIDPLFDLRVTVVGERVFTAAIHSKDPSSFGQVRDWRVGQFQGDIDIIPFKLPPDVEALCLEYTHRMGLQFGAIDLIMDVKNKLWFIECNPNGQWGFVEQYTAQPIGKTMARLLQSGVA